MGLIFRIWVIFPDMGYFPEMGYLSKYGLFSGYGSPWRVWETFSPLTPNLQPDIFLQPWQT